jgi:hypothetical protein
MRRSLPSAAGSKWADGLLISVTGLRTFLPAKNKNLEDTH